MLGGFHWWDLIPVLFIVIVVGGGLVILGRSIGAGYARERRRQEQHPNQP